MTTAASVDGKNKAILVVSFGTSHNDSREITIGAVESAVTKAFPDHDVRRAFTSGRVIDILAKRDDSKIDNVRQAMERLATEGIKDLIVLPTHLIDGFEYDALVSDVRAYRDKFDKLVIGDPLLTSDEDINDVIAVITAETASFGNDETAIVFMGHGTEHEANQIYSKVQERFVTAGYANYFIGTVEAKSGIEEVLDKVKKGGFKKVVLQPLMLVAGNHAVSDMAGDDDGSWKTVLEKAGFEVEIILKGLGQFEGIQKIYVRHVQND